MSRLTKMVRLCNKLHPHPPRLPCIIIHFVYWQFWITSHIGQQCSGCTDSNIWSIHKLFSLCSAANQGPRMKHYFCSLLRNLLMVSKTSACLQCHCLPWAVLEYVGLWASMAWSMLAQQTQKDITFTDRHALQLTVRQVQHASNNAVYNWTHGDDVVLIYNV